ncbi:hypothetical protein SBADM41S_05104 [Streptomyces badius]
MSPSRCGRPRIPAARSTVMSGSVSARCAANPSRAPAATVHHRGAGPPGSERATAAGRAPNPATYGSQDRAVALRRRL